MSWAKFFEHAIEKAPFPVMHEGIQCNVHPDAEGKWVWHVTVRKPADPERVQKHVLGLGEFIKRENVGEGDIDIYEGGSTLRLFHAVRRMRDDEVAKLPAEVDNLTEAFEQKMMEEIIKKQGTN
jgi:hypothetical protein